MSHAPIHRFLDTMRLTVTQKLFALCGLALSGLILLAGFMLWQMQHIYSAANVGNTASVPALAALNKIDAQVGKLRQRAARHVFYADDATTMAKVEQTIQQAKQDIASAFAEYEPYATEPDTRIDDAHRPLDHCHDLDMHAFGNADREPAEQRDKADRHDVNCESQWPDEFFRHEMMQDLNADMRAAPE